MSFGIWCAECKCDHWIEITGCIDRGYKNMLKENEHLQARNELLEKVVEAAQAVWNRPDEEHEWEWLTSALAALKEQT